MKKLSEVTLDDAIKIAEVGFASIFFNKETRKWFLNETMDVCKKPSVLLNCKYNAYEFEFYDDLITAYADLGSEVENKNVPIECYIKAYELGYYVKQLDELANKLLTGDLAMKLNK